MDVDLQFIKLYTWNMYSFLCINHTFVMFLVFFKEPFLKSRCLEGNKVCFTEWTNGLAGGLERGCLKLHPLTRVRTYQPKAAWHQQGALALLLDAGDLRVLLVSPHPYIPVCHWDHWNWIWGELQSYISQPPDSRNMHKANMMWVNPLT